MKKMFIRIGIYAAVFLVFGAILFFSAGNRYTEHISTMGYAEFELVTEPEGVVEIKSAEIKGEFLVIDMVGKAEGHFKLTAYFDDGNIGINDEYDVNSSGRIYNINNGNFAGCSGITLMIIIFISLFSVELLIGGIRGVKHDLYSHNTIYCLGFGVFSLCPALLMPLVPILEVGNFYNFTINQMIVDLYGCINIVYLLSLPFVLIFALSMTVSNISLVRHEGFRPLNLLGMFCGVLLLGGVVTKLFCSYELVSFISNSVVRQLLLIVFDTLIIYFESILLGTMICGLVAAIRKPKPDKDYIIVLGCGIRKDGTLFPLLQGRADRAMNFAVKQKKDTGHRAVLVPSGGQGSDEIMSEGEAMRRYFLSKGVDDEEILPETESANTQQNMLFSKKRIAESLGSDTIPENIKVAFSTTNYHVLRSGILAREAGLNAEGMGSRTKWYFWPNAFMREFVGLLVEKKKDQFVIIGLTILIFVFAWLRA